jgi:RimJ/RimL family protein N-acetyltransferase
VALAVAILVVLAVAGVGWTRVLLGPDLPPEVMAGVAPAMGCAVLMMGALAAVELGVRLRGPGGVLTFLAVSAVGALLAWARRPTGGSPLLRAQSIRTARLDLRPLRMEDAGEMASVLGDPALHGHTGGRPLDVTELRDRYARRVGGRSADGREAWLNWTVRLRSDGAAVGTVQATVAGDRAEVAWVVGVRWQGRGFASEAAVALVGWLRGRGVGAVSATIHPEHRASAGVARRAGLQPTGEVVDGETVWRSPPS